MFHVSFPNARPPYSVVAPYFYDAALNVYVAVDQSVASTATYPAIVFTFSNGGAVVTSI